MILHLYKQEIDSCILIVRTNKIHVYLTLQNTFFLTFNFVLGYSRVWRRKWQPIPVFLPG